MTNIIIPKDAAEYLRTIAGTFNAEAGRLDADLKLWGSDETDDDWGVQIHHARVEGLLHNMRKTAEFAAWLAQFEEGGTQ